MGRSPEQKAKRAAYMRQWKRNHKGAVNATNKSWKDKNRNKVRERGREYMRVRAGTGVGYRKLWLTNCKARAKKKGLPFDLMLNDIIFPSVCPVLGIPLQERAGAFHDNSPSIDRIVPERGYVRGNVQIISYRANRLKCHGTLAELRLIVAYIERHEHDAG